MDTPAPTGEIAAAPAVSHWLSRAQLWPILAVAGGYYLGALVGFGLRFPQSGISFFWPPTAVLTAGLLLNPPASWGGLLCGAFAAHALAHSQNGIPAVSWPVQFIANAVQALLSAYLVRRFSQATRPFADLHCAAGFLVCACVIAPSVASVIPAPVYVMMGWSSDVLTAWRLRTISNAIAALILVPPLVMAWPWLRSKPRAIRGWRVTEYVLLLAGLLAAHGIVAYVDRENALSLALALYAPAPFLIWAAVRFGGSGLSVALLCTTLLTISFAFQEQSFAGGSPGDTIAGVQLFLASTAVPLILIAGLLEQNRAEHSALVEMERQKSATLRALPDLMFVQSRDGVFLEHYAHSNEALYVSPEHFLGRNMRDILPPALVAQLEAAFKTVTIEDPSVLEYSLEIGGEIREFESRFIGLAGDRVLSIVRDITERRRSDDALRKARDRYALATAAGGIGVWSYTVATRDLQVEGGLLALLGYEDGEIGTRIDDWARVVCPADIPEAETRFRAFVAGHAPTYELELRVIAKDGSMRWILNRGALVERSNDVITRVTGTYADITGRKEAEDALKQANDTLVRMGRVTALAELSASIAHELNQPLTAIATNANACLRWMDSAAPHADLRGALTDVVANSRRAGQIVRRTREMFTNQAVTKAPTDLNAVIRNVLDLARARLRESSVTVDLDLADRLPPVEADRVQLQQVVMNLVLNAVEAMVDARSRILSLETKRRGADVLATVRDTGPGVTSPDMDQIFQPFYTTKPEGIGIGLAISRSIVEAHGGSIWAEAVSGEGASFSFTLPAHEASAEPGGRAVERT